MDQFSRQQPGSATGQPGGFLFAALRIFDRILDWLVGLIQLTEEEERDAGIYPGNQRDQ